MGGQSSSNERFCTFMAKKGQTTTRVTDIPLEITITPTTTLYAWVSKGLRIWP